MKLRRPQAAFGAFAKGRDDLSDLLAKFENANQTVITGLKQLAAAYEKNDFGLDPKKKDDLIEIKKAQKLFADMFVGEFKIVDH